MSQRLRDARRIVAQQDDRDPDLEELKEIAARLHGKGIDFVVERGSVVIGGRQPAIGAPEHVIVHTRERLRIGVVSDTHGGSKFEQLSALRDFYRQADEAEVDFFVHAGDATQGSDRMHRDQYLGLHAHGADAQAGYVAAVYPRSERGVPTYMIGGNHDATFLNDGGVNVVRRIAAERPDIVYLGDDAAYLRVAGLLAYVAHPSGGGAYAKSYKLQRFAASLPTDPPISLLLVGHYHSYAKSIERPDIIALQLPCFQTQYSWLARKGLYPDIGGIILNVWLDDDGRPVRVREELVRYQPRDDDWDRDVSFAMEHRWSKRGNADEELIG
jgi:predicted phosphodiesterase